MTCAKQTVKCVIRTLNNDMFYGENFCLNTQKTCPRTPDEGHEKCVSICNQQGHAEVQAINAAKAVGADLRGATCEISGHYWICKNCAGSLRAEGITTLIVRVS